MVSIRRLESVPLYTPGILAISGTGVGPTQKHVPKNLKAHGGRYANVSVGLLGTETKYLELFRTSLQLYLVQHG